jgi:cbb3-type cytochrome oxidase maturation protein
MSVIYVLIPIAVLFVMIGLAIFFWAVRSKQFEDLDKQGFSILFDDDKNHSKDEPAEQQPATKQKINSEHDEH